jgi:putative redox protein
MMKDATAHPGATGPVAFRTTCGRDLRVGRLALGSAEQPSWRVSLDVGRSPDRGDGTWAGLTPAEARRLAAALLEQAAAAERAARADGAGPDAASQAGDGRIDVAHADGESYAFATRGHTALTDQPASNGGADAAPTPTELLVAALATCVAFYAGRYLERHSLDRDGLRVTAEFTMAADRPARVGAIRLRVTVPAGVPAGRRAALLAVASHCTVHNTLRQEPVITVDLA